MSSSSRQTTTTTTKPTKTPSPKNSPPTIPMETTTTTTEISPLIPVKTDSNDIETATTPAPAPLLNRLLDVTLTSFLLGIENFGDSYTQVAITQYEIVEKRRWMTNDTFMELFALTRGLPGPFGTQLVICSGMVHAGAIGGFLALVAWVLPGAAILTAAGVALNAVMMDPNDPPRWLLGIPPATVALLFKATYGFGSQLDRFDFFLAGSSCVGAVMVNGDVSFDDGDSSFMYPIMLVLGGLITLVDSYLPRFCRLGRYDEVATRSDKAIAERVGMSVGMAVIIVQLWLIILLASMYFSSGEFTVDGSKKYLPLMDLFKTFYRVGSSVFGGGEDVIAMITTQMVPRFVSSKELFFQGLGLAQALPGSVFNIAAFVGGVYQDVPGALVSLLGIFLPSYLFSLVGMTLWAKLRLIYWFKAFLNGVNAVGVGFIAAACIFLWEASVKKAADACIVVVSLGLCTYYASPAPFVIIVAAAMGYVFDRFSLAQIPYNS